jgi:hypothetical protein
VEEWQTTRRRIIASTLRNLGYRQGRRNRQGLLYADPFQFGTKLEQSQMVGILALQRAHQEFELWKSA